MSRIHLVDLEVFYHIGITEEERARPQRLLITVELDLDIEPAAASDRIEQTINYHAIARRLLQYGANRSWNLLEKLTLELADLILAEFQPRQATVEVKKFPIPQARYVSVRVTRARVQDAALSPGSP